MEKESVHKNHRRRVKEKFMKHGLETFEEHEVLEMMLFYVIPRRNTNEIAHELIKKFGSIQDVLNASYSSLIKVKGVGIEAACFIKFILGVVRRYVESSDKFVNKFSTRLEINDYLSKKFIGRTEEMIAIVLLDAKKKVLYEGIISDGTHSKVNMNMRKIIELVSFYNAAAIAIAHNHPSGIALPSKEDIDTTKRLKFLFDSLNVYFVDHIIVADDDYISFRDCNFPDIFEDSSEKE